MQEEISNGQNILRGNIRRQPNNQQRSRFVNGRNRNNNVINRNDLKSQNNPGGQRPTLINQLRTSPQISGTSRQNNRGIIQNSGRIAQNSGRISQTSGRISQNSGQITQNNGRIAQSSGRIAQNNAQNNGRITQHRGELRQNIRQFRQDGGGVGRTGARTSQINTRLNAGRVRQNNLLQGSDVHQQRNGRVSDNYSQLQRLAPSLQQTQYNNRISQRGNRIQQSLVNPNVQRQNNSRLLLLNNEQKTLEVNEQFKRNQIARGSEGQNLRSFPSVNMLQNPSPKQGGINSSHDSRPNNINSRQRTMMHALRVLPAINQITSNRNARNNLQQISNNRGLKGDSEGLVENASPRQKIGLINQLGGRRKNQKRDEKKRLRSQRPQMVNRILGRNINQQLNSEQHVSNRNENVLPYVNQINRNQFQNARQSHHVNQINTDQYQNKQQINQHTSRGINNLTPDSPQNGLRKQGSDQLPLRQSFPLNTLQEPQISQPNDLIELTPNDRFFPGSPSSLNRTVKQSTGNGQSLLVNDVGNILLSHPLGDSGTEVKTSKEKQLKNEEIKSQREINPRRLRNHPRLKILPAGQATNVRQRRLRYRLRTRLNSRYPSIRSSPRIQQRGSTSYRFGMTEVITTSKPSEWQGITLNPDFHNHMSNLGHSVVSNVDYITDTLTAAADQNKIFQNNNDTDDRLGKSKPQPFQRRPIPHPNLTERQITMQESFKEPTSPIDMMSLQETDMLSQEVNDTLATIMTTSKVSDRITDSLKNRTTKSNIEITTTWPIFSDEVILRKTEGHGTHPTSPSINMRVEESSNDIATPYTAEGLGISSIKSQKSKSKKPNVPKYIKKASGKHSIPSERLNKQEPNLKNINKPASSDIPWIWPDFPAYDSDHNPFDEIQKMMPSTTIPTTKAWTTTPMTTTEKPFYKILDFNPFKDTKVRENSKGKSNILTDFLWENPMERLNSLTNNFDMYKQLAAVNNDFGLTPNAFSTDKTRIPPPPAFKPPVVHKKKTEMPKLQESKYSTFGNIYLTGGSTGVKIKTIDVSSLMKKTTKSTVSIDTKVAKPKVPAPSRNIKKDNISQFPKIVDILERTKATTTNGPTTRYPTTIITTSSPKPAIVVTTSKPLTTQPTTRITTRSMTTMKPTTAKPTSKLITTTRQLTTPTISTLLPTTQIVNMTQHEENVKAELAKMNEIIRESLMTGFIRTGLQGITSSRGKNIRTDEIGILTMRTPEVTFNPTTRQPSTLATEKTNSQPFIGITEQPRYNHDLKLSANYIPSLVHSTIDMMTENAKPSNTTLSHNHKGHKNSNKHNQIIMKQPQIVTETSSPAISKYQNATTVVKATKTSKDAVLPTTTTKQSFNKSEIIQEVQEELLKNSTYVDALVENYIFRHLISPQEDPLSALLGPHGQLPSVNLQSFGISSKNIQANAVGSKTVDIPQTTETYITSSSLQNTNSYRYDNRTDQNRTQNKVFVNRFTTLSHKMYTTEPTHAPTSQSVASTLSSKLTTISDIDRDIYRLLSQDINSFMKMLQTTPTSTVKPTTTTVKPTTTTVKPTTTTFKPNTSVKPTTTIVKPNTTTIEHTTTTVKPTTTTVKPTTTAVKPTTTSVKSTTITVKPTIITVKPTTTTVKPTTTTAKSTPTTVKPITTTAKPTTTTVKPTTAKPTTTTVKPTTTTLMPTTVKPTITTIKPTTVKLTTTAKLTTSTLKPITSSKTTITLLNITHSQRSTKKTTSTAKPEIRPTTTTSENEIVKEEKLFNKLKSLIQNLFSSISTEPGVTTKPDSEKHTFRPTTTRMTTISETSTPSVVSTTNQYQKENTITFTERTTLIPTTSTTESPESSSTIRTTTNPTTEKTVQTTTTRPTVHSDEALYKKLYDDLFSKMFANSHNPPMHHPFIPGSPWHIQGRNNVPSQFLSPQFHFNGQQVPYPTDFNSWTAMHHPGLLARGISPNNFWDRSMNQNPFHTSNRALGRSSFDTSSTFEQKINPMSNNIPPNIANLENQNILNNKSKSKTNPSPDVKTLVSVQQSNLANTQNDKYIFTTSKTRPVIKSSVLQKSHASSYLKSVTSPVTPLTAQQTVTTVPIHNKRLKIQKLEFKTTTASSTNKKGHTKPDNSNSITNDHIVKQDDQDPMSKHKYDKIVAPREHTVQLTNKPKQKFQYTTSGHTTVRQDMSPVKLTSTTDAVFLSDGEIIYTTEPSIDVTTTDNPYETNTIESSFEAETTEQPRVVSSTQSIAVSPEIKTTTEDPSQSFQLRESTIDGSLSDHTTSYALKINQKDTSITANPTVEPSKMGVRGHHQNAKHDSLTKHHQHHLPDLSQDTISSTQNRDNALSNEVSDLALINQMIRSLIGTNETFDGLLQSEPNVTRSNTGEVLSSHSEPENRLVNQTVQRQNADGSINQLRMVTTTPETGKNRFGKPPSNPFIFNHLPNRQDTRNSLQFMTTTTAPTPRPNPFLRHVPSINPKFAFVPHNSIHKAPPQPGQRKNPFLNRAPTINPLFSFNKRPEENSIIPSKQNIVTKDAIMKKFMEKKVIHSHDSQLVPDETGSMGNHVPNNSTSILQKVLMKTLVELDKSRVDPMKSVRRGHSFADSPPIQVSTRITTTTTNPPVEEGGATTEEPGDLTTMNLQDIEIGDIQPTFPPNSTVPPGGEWEEYYYYY
ncbi:hypothetical protein LOTGIDRAFT_167099 [Lottia gigantea]|uniref:Uncharacterized protein n=1 Tax=Lottia gigantea TaxID=225164 RepID=V3ZZZ6_LOTGI|nr:hypothetical protein LOTGIDRAFT_167099 [Lottia gigantea]ESO86576.1 hypothetical protein LOTGIDRAFT_167099 [Lottia gigantea]